MARLLARPWHLIDDVWFRNDWDGKTIGYVAILPSLPGWSCWLPPEDPLISIPRLSALEGRRYIDEQLGSRAYLLLGRAEDEVPPPLVLAPWSIEADGVHGPPVVSSVTRSERDFEWMVGTHRSHDSFAAHAMQSADAWAERVKGYAVAEPADGYTASVMPSMPHLLSGRARAVRRLDLAATEAGGREVFAGRHPSTMPGHR